MRGQLETDQTRLFYEWASSREHRAPTNFPHAKRKPLQSVGSLAVDLEQAELMNAVASEPLSCCAAETHCSTYIMRAQKLASGGHPHCDPDLGR